MSDTTKDAVPLTDEQIAALKAAALAATPQNIDSAQRIERYEDGSHIECPACSGEGHVELEADFCNYDGAAIGVQFYGIGNAHGAAEAYLRAAMPATILALIDRLERAQVQAEAVQVDSIARLIAFHAEQLEANPYCYFELAYTRQTDWMAWITDRPAQGEPGTAAYAKSRKVIVRGQGATAEEACADALAALAAPSTGDQS